MLKLLLVSMAFLSPALAEATTFRVENRSAATLDLALKHGPEEVARQLQPKLLPHESAFFRRPGGKVLASLQEANTHLVDIVVTSGKGRGCRFRTVAEAHSDGLVLIVPVADPIGSGRCQARTGRTIGDFVFIAS